MNDVNRFVENQTQVPFTVKNIFRMFEIIVGTKNHNFNKALEEVVDNFTKHTHENRFGVAGWKSNSGYMLNKKFIIDWAFEVSPSYSRNAGRLQTRYGAIDKLKDLTKVLCNITGIDYYKTTPIDKFVDSFNGLKPGRWYENGFFEIRGYKKGTMHLKFTDEKVWEQLNRAYAKIKGEALPETTWKSKQEPEQPKQSTKQTTKTTQHSNNFSVNPIVAQLIKEPINSDTILQMFA